MAQAVTDSAPRLPAITEQQARTMLEHCLWPDGQPRCPHCNSINAYRMRGSSCRPGLCRCRDCNRQFTVTVGTVFEGSRVPLRQWMQALVLLSNGPPRISTLELQRRLGLGSYHTARQLVGRARRALSSEALKPVLERLRAGAGAGTSAAHRAPGSSDHAHRQSRMPTPTAADATTNVTIRDVASACGVSVGTVSSVLANKAGFRESTRRKVHEAVSRLNYDPLRHLAWARHLATRSIGLIVPALYSPSSSFFAQAVNAAYHFASQQDLDLRLLNAEDLKHRLAQGHGGLGGLNVHGLVFFCCELAPSAISDIVARGIRVAMVRRDMDVPGVVVVTNDDEAGMERAVEHLHRRGGHTKIGLVAPHLRGDVQTDRLQGYRRYVRRHGLSDEPDLVMQHHQLGGRFAPTLAQLVRDRRLTAVACANDSQAIAACKAMFNVGLRVPEDLAVVGYTNTDNAAAFHPALTSVNVPVEPMVAAACAAVLDAQGEAAGTRRVQTFDSKLIVRESCGVAQAEPATDEPMT